MAHDPDALLLEAVLLAHDGDFAAAMAVCTRLLAIDELNAGAHYVLALCHERHDRERAAYHDQIAAYLDPTFAMPRVHLGLMLQRSGDGEAAYKELQCARALLEREDSARLVMFGGGFGRAALLALCSVRPDRSPA
jgi:chemotaxis protein methyltransferase CheR